MFFIQYLVMLEYVLVKNMGKTSEADACFKIHRIWR